MRVGGAAAVPWEVLYGASDVLAVVRLDKPSGILRHHSRVGREAAAQLAYYGAVRIDIHIDVGGDIHIHASPSQIFSHDGSVVHSSVAAVHLAQMAVAHRWVESVLSLESRHAAALLVESNKEFAASVVLKLRSERSQAFARSDVSRAQFARSGEIDVEKNHAAHMQVAHISHGVAVGSYAIGFESHHKHCGGIFAEFFLRVRVRSRGEAARYRYGGNHR